MKEEIVEIDINRLTTSKFNARRDMGDLTELAESIKSGGIIEPLIVRKKGNKYEIIIGERRYRGGQLAVKRTLPCIVKDYSDIEAIEFSLKENLHRKNLTPLERADGIQCMLDAFSEKYPNQEAIAKSLGVTQGRISQWLEILSYPKVLLDEIDEGNVPLEHGKLLQKYKDPCNLENIRILIKWIKRIKKRHPTSEQLKAELEKFNRLSSGTKPKEQRMYPEAKGFPSFFVGCKFNCKYCKTSFQRLMKRQPCELCQKYEPHVHYKRFWTKPPKTKGNEFLFMCDCGDIAFADPLTFHYVITYCCFYGNRTFLIQSKNPNCFKDYHFPENVILGTTIETNRQELIKKIKSKAPLPESRYEAMLNLNHKRKSITIEPIMKFDLDIMVKWVRKIKPEVVYVGYDSHPKENKLDEPTLAETKQLITELRKLRIEVREKLIRPAWDETKG